MAQGGNRRGGGKKQYDNTNRIAIFKNKDKTDAKHADYRGTVNVDGRELRVSLWLDKIKNGDNAGDTYMKGVVEEPQAKGGGQNFEQRQAPAPAPQPAKGGADFDDDIPF